MVLEVCAQSLQSAMTAQIGGAQRIEFCSGLELGGLTPSAAHLQLARERLHINICVLIRPRAGDFLYNELEFETILKDVEYCKQLGIDGVVVGCLRPDNTFDETQMKAIAAVAGNMELVSHRAFDATPNPFEAMETLINLGYHRILTSGQANVALDGIPVLKQLVDLAQARIDIMAGSGVLVTNIEQLARATGAKDFHSSFKKGIKSASEQYQNQNQYNNSHSLDYFETDLAQVQAAVDVLKKLGL